MSSFLMVHVSDPYNTTLYIMDFTILFIRFLFSLKFSNQFLSFIEGMFSRSNSSLNFCITLCTICDHASKVTEFFNFLYFLSIYCDLYCCFLPSYLHGLGIFYVYYHIILCRDLI